MYLLIVYHKDHTKYYGPFQSMILAANYYSTLEHDTIPSERDNMDYKIVDLIIPYRVKQIVWRES